MTTAPDAEPDHSPTPSRVPWPPLLLVGAIATAAVLGQIVPLHWPGLDDGPARLVGYGFGVAGLTLILWSGVTLWRADTTIRPDRPARRLVTDGPYRFGRNPIYAGDALIMLGLAQATLNIWYVMTAAVFMLAVLKLAVEPEERHLEVTFGDDYRAWVARTRRWI